MKAVVKYAQKPDMVELRDVPKPEVRRGSVLLEVKAAGVCGWDIEMWKHRMANPVTVPVIQGHEFCGVIAEVGDGVTGWKIGDRVVSETSAYICGRCRWCRAGEYQVCPERKGFGYGVDGAFTKYVVVRQGILYKIPASISFEEAALTEPFCVAYHALVDRINIVPGDTVVVIGPGPIGLISLQIAKVQGAEKTILIGNDISLMRMEVAKKEKWADAIVNIDHCNPIDMVMEMTHREGADVVVDAVGNSAALITALESVRPLGQIAKIGWGPKPFNQSLDTLLRKSITLSGTFGHNSKDWQAAIRLLETGKLNVKSLISGVLPLSKWKEAYEKAESCKAIKMVLTPEE